MKRAITSRRREVWRAPSRSAVCWSGGSGPEAQQQMIHAVEFHVQILELRIEIFPLRQAASWTSLRAERGVDLGHRPPSVELRDDARRQRRQLRPPREAVE